MLEKGFKVALINPLTTDAYRRGKLKTSKTDKLDCLLIIKVLQMNEDFRRVTLDDYHLREMKQLTRHHHTLTEDLQRIKARLQACIDIVFPEFNRLFDSTYSIVYLRVLKELSSAFTISKTDIRAIRKLFAIRKQGKRIQLTPEELKLAASKSIGEINPIIELEIKHYVSQIELIKEQLNSIDTKIKEFSNQLNSPITSIPGIAHISGMTILSELGDIHRFSSAAKVIRYAGMNPFDIQSGNFTAQATRITKKGSSNLRKSLYQIISHVIRFNPVFQHYYTKKLKEGKGQLCAQGHCVRKLLRVIYKLLTENQTFSPIQLN